MGKMWTAAVDFSSVGGQQVYYTVGDATDASAIMTFLVPLAPGASTSFSFLLWADQGVGYDDEGEGCSNQ